MLNVVFRVDADHKIGFGHLKRCLALARKFLAIGCQVSIVGSKQTISYLKDMPLSGLKHFALNTNEHPTQDQGLSEESDFLELSSFITASIDILILDHYGLNEKWERLAMESSRLFVVIDDFVDKTHHCDLLVNPGLDGPNISRDINDHAGKYRILHGRRFALLAEPEDNLNKVAKTENVTNVLISLGGTDPNGATKLILTAITESNYSKDRFYFKVIFGGSEEDYLAISKLFETGILLGEVIKPHNKFYAELLWSDRCILTPSTSFLEAKAFGRDVGLVLVVENQISNYRYAIKHKLATDIADLFHDSGKFDSTVMLNWLESSNLNPGSSNHTIDFLGANRVVNSALDLMSYPVSLDKFTSDDELFLLELQNQKNTRRWFRNTAVPTPEEHHDWFQEFLNSSDNRGWVVSILGTKVGIVRLHKNEIDEEVSIIIDQRFRGMGLATKALDLVDKYSETRWLKAQIEPGNKGSVKAFLHANYKRISDLWFEKRVPE